MKLGYRSDAVGQRSYNAVALPSPILQVASAVEMCNLSKEKQTSAQMNGLTTEHHAVSSSQ